MAEPGDSSSGVSADGRGTIPGRPRHGRLDDGLPHDLSSFIGRERELAQVVGLIERARLVTLVGPGGSGKTRLAIEAARRAASAMRPRGRLRRSRAGRRPGSDRVVDRGRPGDPARTVTDRRGRPASRTSRDRSLLLVLDNLEQLLPEAGPSPQRARRSVPGPPPAGHQPGAAPCPGRAGVPRRAPRPDRGPGAVPRPGSRGRLRVRADGYEPAGGRGDLPAPRRPAARDRAGRRSIEGADSRGAPAPAGSGRRAAGVGGGRCAGPPAHPARHDRLELRPAEPGRAHGVQPGLRVRRRVRRRGRGRGRGRSVRPRPDRGRFGPRQPGRSQPRPRGARPSGRAALRAARDRPRVRPRPARPRPSWTASDDDTPGTSRSCSSLGPTTALLHSREPSAATSATSGPR